MAALMTAAGAIFDGIIDMLTDLVTLVTGTGKEILLLGILVPLAFLGVNMFRKLLNL